MSAPLCTDWIAADWGTTRLRVWAMDATGTVLAEAASDRGMGSLEPGGFEPALLELVEPWLGDGSAPVLACGMVGARQGWVEVPYRTVPCAPVAAPAPAPVSDPRIAVGIIPGLAQTSPPDVMRGEETQIAGFLSLHPGFDGVICLPGTHSKWVRVSAGEVVSFSTAMTGELFAVLSRFSVLRHSIDPPKEVEHGWNDEAFRDAVDETLSRPERLAGRLFGIRAEGLLAGLAPAAARARLSGLLIGAELAATRPYWLGQDVVLLGAPDLSARYRSALALQGLDAKLADVTQSTLAGLALGRAAFTEETR